MSQASKITLGATSLFAVGTIIFVHFQQKAEQAVRFLSSDPTEHLAWHIIV
jgi:hypothetical protein